MKKTKILVIGACGQIGAELITALSTVYGRANVFAADIHETLLSETFINYIQLDVLDHALLESAVIENEITQIYLLAAMLSATGEQKPALAWKLNVQSLLSVLNIAKDHQLDKVFWPSSIAVFGPDSPKYNCPQNTRIEPNTVYGISKRAGEYWCNYYFEKYGVDVRSLRFPGLISHTAPPGGGTTDYAVDIFHQALEKGEYTCYISEDNCLPMMYMDDAIRATLELMQAPEDKVSIRTSYNIAGISFAPCDLASAIRKHIPEFKISYLPDSRNAIASSWPASIRDDQARNDWQWKPAFTLSEMTNEMLVKLSERKGIALTKKRMDVLGYPDFQLD